MSLVGQRKVLTQIQPYIPGKPISHVQRELGLTNVIKMASNENPLGCSPKATEAVRRWAENMALYPDGSCNELNEVLSLKLGIKQEQLLFGAGSDQIVEMIAQAYINPGDESIMPFPSFPRYETVTRIMDGNPIEIKLNSEYRLDLSAYTDSVTERTRVIWICNPNNPTGTIITSDEQRSFLEKVPSSILVVLDEAYYEYAKGEDYPESIKLLDEYPNIIILRTFSKAFGLAGLRVGYAISSPQIISSLNKVRAPFNVNTAAQVAALAAINDDEFLDLSVETNHLGKHYLYEAFDDLGLPYIPTHANFVMVNLNLNSQEIFDALLREGIIVRPGVPFMMPGWIRLTIGTPEENNSFIRALKKILKR